MTARVAVLFLACHILLPDRAEAEEEEKKTYEEERLEQALRDEGLTRRTGTGAHRIDFIRFVRDEVFVDGEGPLSWFRWANLFHTTTTEGVIGRELLFREGDTFDATLVEETMRNLRNLGIFTHVRIEPVVDEDGTTGALVYTRELWSLRTETDLKATGRQVDYFLLLLTERNLAGRNKALSARFVLEPLRYRFGDVYTDRRLGGGRLSLFQFGELIFRRGQGDLEGGRVFGILERPFFNLAQHFGYELRWDYSTEVVRPLTGSRIRTYDIPETATAEMIPEVYRDRLGLARLLALYRHGQHYRLTAGGGWEFRDRQAKPIAETGLTDRERPFFERDILPRVRREVGPVLRYRLFVPAFDKHENLGTFGQTETLRSGPEVDASVRFPLEAFGSSTDSVFFDMRLAAVASGHGGTAQVGVRGQARLEDGDVVDQRLLAEVRAATPVLRFVRLVGRLTYQGLRNDMARRVVSLGGDNGLRGYQSARFSETSGNLIRGNLEIRTLPLELWSVHFGLVAFYDVGTIYRGRDTFALHHGVGLGIRLLFPQFNPIPFAFDGGIPASEEFGFVPSIGTQQVVPLTPLEDLTNDSLSPFDPVL